MIFFMAGSLAQMFDREDMIAACLSKGSVKLCEMKSVFEQYAEGFQRNAQ
jgi:hypothetical protein